MRHCDSIVLNTFNFTYCVWAYSYLVLFTTSLILQLFVMIFFIIHWRSQSLADVDVDGCVCWRSQRVAFYNLWSACGGSPELELSVQRRYSYPNTFWNQPFRIRNSHSIANVKYLNLKCINWPSSLKEDSWQLNSVVGSIVTIYNDSITFVVCLEKSGSVNVILSHQLISFDTQPFYF